MPLTAVWDADRRLWCLEVGESLTLGEIAELIDRDDLNDCRRFLWDLRRLQRGPDSTAQLHGAAKLLEKARERWQGVRSAVLVARDLDFGMARMFEAFSDGMGVEVAVFREFDLAVAWLNEDT